MRCDRGEQLLAREHGLLMHERGRNIAENLLEFEERLMRREVPVVDFDDATVCIARAG